MAKEAGLDMADESYDSLLFWKSLESAPMHEGVTLKEQVDYMVSQVKAKKGKVAAARSETSPESEILERGGTPRPRPGDGDTSRALWAPSGSDGAKNEDFKEITDASS